jgi:hypothetical protein
LQAHFRGAVEGLIEFYGHGATVGAGFLRALAEVFLPGLDIFGI